MYDLSNVLAVAQAETVRAGSSLLISGPAMTGKDDLAFNILGDGLSADEGAIAVTTNGTAEDTVAELQARAGTIDAHQVTAIDCRGDGNRQTEQVEDGIYVQRVGSPGNLTDIGIAITQSFDRLQDAGVDQGRLALTSLSTMLTYTDKETVFKFSHVLSSRLDAADFLGVFTIDSTAHDEQTLQIIKQSFDGLVEVRENSGRQARIRGLSSEPSQWVEF
jgi:KaiC/GvpD/RAD55 family RecA-like ATPase